MEPSQLQESNKLIAEFMGAKPCKDWQGNDGFEHPSWYHLQWSNRFQDNIELYSYKYSELRYDKSWDWLMPVVEKIESLEHEVIITSQRTIIQIPRGTGISCNYKNKLENTYKAVVEFIQWYNAVTQGVNTTEEKA